MRRFSPGFYAETTSGEYSCRRPASRSRDSLFQPCEATHPALLMMIARFGVGELLVPERELRAAARRAQLDRHDRLPLRRALPRPGVDELLVRHDLAVHATHVVHLAVGRMHDNVVAPADACIGLR